MKTLLLIRHAKSSWEHPDLTDHDRPLNARGERDAPRMAKVLRERGTTVEAMYSSTAVRALRLAEVLAPAMGVPVAAIQQEERLYDFCGAGIEALRSEIPASLTRVLLVGHNPALEMVLERLTGVAFEKFPTAAVAAVALESWPAPNGELLWWDKPKNHRE